VFLAESEIQDLNTRDLGLNMAKQWIIQIAVCLLFCSALAVGEAQTAAISQDVIHILPDGTVTPVTAPIHHNGSFYQLTDNISTAIVIERNNITLDGRGFTVQGNGAIDLASRQAAISLRCMGTTVENFQFKDWWVGVLGVYDGNRIVGNDFTDVDISVAVYANNYEITQNYLDYVRVVGSNIHIYSNEIQIKSYGTGIWVSNSTNLTVEANNVKMGSLITSFISVTGNSSFKVFYNNFFDANKMQFSKGQFYLFGIPGLSNITPWDDGYPSGGNYWGDYTKRYSNASALGDSGIWDTKYLLQADYNSSLIDRYPLVNPYNVQVAALPTPPPAGSIEDNPTPSVPELPVWAMFAVFAAAATTIIGVKRKQTKATSAESP
jgi:hypothetical protein